MPKTVNPFIENNDGILTHKGELKVANYDVEQKKYKTTVLNEKNEKILTQYEAVQAIPLDAGIEEVPYEKSVLQYHENGKVGLIDFTGKKITEAIYDKITSIKMPKIPKKFSSNTL